MTARALTSSELREQFPAGTVMHNPVTGEYARVVEQEERFEVVDDIVFERPPRAVQRALAVTVAPIVRRRGLSVTGETMRAAIVPAAQWPGRF
jgi:hypothetical protein